jgi:hypothetical protein
LSAIERDAPPLDTPATQTWEAEAHVLGGQAMYMLGDHERGLAVIAQARSLFESRGDRQMVARIDLDRAELLADGDVVVAAALLESASNVFIAIGDNLSLMRASRLRSKL